MTADIDLDPVGLSKTRDLLTAPYRLIGFAFGAIYRMDRALFWELRLKAIETAALGERLSPGNACSKEHPKAAR